MSFNLGDATPIPIPSVLTVDMESILNPDIFNPTGVAPFTVPGGILSPTSSVPATSVPTVKTPNNAWLIVGAVMATYFLFGKRR